MTNPTSGGARQPSGSGVRVAAKRTTAGGERWAPPNFDLDRGLFGGTEEIWNERLDPVLTPKIQT